MSTDDTAASHDWHETFSLALPHLSVSDIVSISSCSKAAFALFTAHLSSGQRELARNLLIKTTRDAACSNSADLQQKLTSCIQWLLQNSNIPKELMLSDSPAFLSTHNVPLSICKLLVAAGVRISHEQLVSEARSGSAGVFNWVVAESATGTPTGLSNVMQALCLGEVLTYEDLSTLTSGSASDVVVVAIAMLHQDSHYDRCIWGGTCINVCRRTSALQQLEPAAVLQLLQQAVEVLQMQRFKPYYPPCKAKSQMLADLCSLPGVKQIDAADVYQLLKSAVERQMDTAYLLALLQGFSDSGRLDADMVIRLMEIQLQLIAANTCPHDLMKYTAVRILCRMSAAQLIPSDCCLRLFKTALKAHCTALQQRQQQYRSTTAGSNDSYTTTDGDFHALVGIKGMQQIDAAMLLDLLQHSLTMFQQYPAATGHNFACMVMCSLCRSGLPGAEGISIDAAKQLMQKAKGLGGAVGQQMCDILASLPAVKRLKQHVDLEAGLHA